MKQKDVVLIIAVSVVSAILALVLSNLLVNNSKNRSLTAEVVEPITSDFILPEKKYFSANSIDPTKLIRIGDGSNDDPFKDNQ